MALFGLLEASDVAVLFTLILLEGVLSFDNAAILAAMVRRLPREQQRKALLYGLGGAYLFRILAILGVAYIIRFPILKLVGGLYLLWLMFNHIRPKHDPSQGHGAFLQRIGFTGFWATVIMVELADIAFALDQVLVAVAMTDKIWLIVTAALIAILFLRIGAAYMTRLMDWFPRLETLAYLAVGFVGGKLVLVELMHSLGYEHFEVPKVISITVTLTLLVVPVAGKFLWERVGPGRPGQHTTHEDPDA